MNSSNTSWAYEQCYSSISLSNLLLCIFLCIFVLQITFNFYYYYFIYIYYNRYLIKYKMNMCILYTRLMCTRDQCVYAVNLTSDHIFTRPFDVENTPIFENIRKKCIGILIPSNILHIYKKNNFGQIFLVTEAHCSFVRTRLDLGTRYSVWTQKIDS